MIENKGFTPAQSQGFDILENDRGELLLVLPLLRGLANSPLIIVSSDQNKAIFRRSSKQMINLSIDVSMISKLRKARKILVIEADDQRISETYQAVVTVGNM